MPTYDFRCPNGHSFSQVASVHTTPASICPRCNTEAIRVFTAPPISFKGEGFVSERG